VPGDGIGPEVTSQGLRLLHMLNDEMNLGLSFVEKDWGAERWLKDGVGLPKGALEDLLANYRAVYFGALGDPRIPDMAHGRDILLGLRFGLDLFINMRPVRLLATKYCPLKDKTPADIDFVVFRENTEDCYVSMGGRFKQNTDDEFAIDECVHTRKGVTRIVQAAFRYAMASGRKKVTLIDKANAVRFGGGLWRDVFASVSKTYPSLQTDALFVDVAAMEMVRAPERFDVVVTSNLFGDILTDLGAGIVGGLGLAASANLHPGRMGLFEPVHGSAPDIAGTKRANPLAAFLTAAQMLSYLEMPAAAKRIEDGVAQAIAADMTTPDLGGKLATAQVTDYILDCMKAS